MIGFCPKNVVPSLKKRSSLQGISQNPQPFDATGVNSTDPVPDPPAPALPDPDPDTSKPFLSDGLRPDVLVCGLGGTTAKGFLEQRPNTKQ